MLQMIFNRPRDAALNVLFLGAHSDDIEIGCGGAILRLSQQYSNLNVHWVVFGAQDERVQEARRSAEDFLARVSQKTIIVKGFRDGFLPYRGEEVKNYFEELKETVSPDIIFTHYRHDLHQDHRLICELTWNTFRDHVILEYEIPKYDGDLGSPNFFIHLDDATRAQKVEKLLKYFKTQSNKIWFTEETFNGLMRLRGIESKAPQGYAEGFYGRKIAF